MVRKLFLLVKFLKLYQGKSMMWIHLDEVFSSEKLCSSLRSSLLLIALS